MKLQPIDPQTRIRADHNTAGEIKDYADTSEVITGTEVFTAPVDFTYNGTVIQFKGDRWLKVEYVNDTPASGWIAITHKGLQICREIPETEPVPVTDEYIVYYKVVNGVIVDQRKFVKEA